MSQKNYDKIPEYTRIALDRYVNEREMPGGFLQAVLVNDLAAAICLGDSENLAALPDLVLYIYNDIPSVCWGSKENVRDWLNAREY